MYVKEIQSSLVVTDEFVTGTLMVKLYSFDLKGMTTARGIARRRPGSSGFSIFPSVLKLNR